MEIFPWLGLRYRFSGSPKKRDSFAGTVPSSRFDRGFLNMKFMGHTYMDMGR